MIFGIYRSQLCRRGLRLSLIANASILVLLIVACSTSGSPGPPAPLHIKLANVHVARGGEGKMPFNDETLESRRFDFLLERLSSKCRMTPVQIGDMTVVGQNLLLEDGVDVPLLELMEAFNQSIVETAPIPCDETFAALVQPLSLQ